MDFYQVRQDPACLIHMADFSNNLTQDKVFSDEVNLLKTIQNEIMISGKKINQFERITQITQTNLRW